MSGRKSLTGKAAVARRMTFAVRDLLTTYKSVLEDSVREYGLTLPQLRLLNVVSQQTEASAAAIARECHVRPQTLQAMLTRAVREGWIVRGTSARNHRILTASLTAKGQRLLERGMQAAEDLEARTWSETSRKTLEKAIAVLEAGTKSLRSEKAPSPARKPE